MKNRLMQYFVVISLLCNTAQASSFNDEQKQEIEKIVHEYLVKHPEVLAQAIQALQNLEAKAWMEQVKKVIVQRLDELFNSSSPKLSENKSTINIVEFFDYNCPHCKKFSKILDATLSQDNGIQVIYKELPILSEGSIFSAKAALAAQEQNKYKDFHQKLMSYEGVLSDENVLKIAQSVGLDVKKLKTDMDNPKIMNELRNNQKLAIELGIRGTPTIIIGKNPATKNMPIEVIPGDVTQQVFEQKISNVRNSAPFESTDTNKR